MTIQQTGAALGHQSLADRYGELLEDLEDINYRMYDLYFRQYPDLRTQFSEKRSQHPRVVDAIFSFRSNIADAGDLMQFLNVSGCESLNCSHLRRLRLSFLQALKDVLFDDADEALIKDCTRAFDALLGSLLEYRQRAVVKAADHSRPLPF